MRIGLAEEHEALAEVVDAFAADRGLTSLARRMLESPGEPLGGLWGEMAELGWLGLHLPVEHGGQGYGLLELGIVAEALGAAMAPGPFLPTVVVAATVASCGTPDQQAVLLPALASGACVAALGLTGDLTREGDRVRGVGRGVLGAPVAHTVALVVGNDVALVEAPDVTVEMGAGLDPTRPAGAVRVDGATADWLPGAARTARRVLRALAAAEAAGLARACVGMAVAYATEREQFGRPIGSFQAVKHHLADMFVDAQLAAAAAWEALGGAHRSAAEAELAAAVAATQAITAATRGASRNIQVHGGIGYTWEHDAHLYLRRAAALSVLVDPSTAARDVVALVRDGVPVEPGFVLPEEAEGHRDEVRAFRARLEQLTPEERRRALVDSGYLVPHWPRPWGRGAGPVEQLVIDEELAELEAPDLGIGTWVLPTIIQHGTPEQLERWIRPSLLGEMRWCQLFSEPNAGSDAAAITTRATRVDGGFVVNGQKVWTSDAANATMGLATVRTDPDAPKHAGVTVMAIDMRAPGVEVRPLREITGETLFNEVFLTDVFVPDDDVVGAVGDGWTVARATLGNERVSIGANRGRLDLVSAAELVALADGAGTDEAEEVGRLVAEERALGAVNLRQVARAVAGAPPGPEGNVTKLVSAEHAQRVADAALALAGPDAITGANPRVARNFLFTRCLTIAGGTSEILRNVIAERILGLPRDPLLR